MLWSLTPCFPDPSNHISRSLWMPMLSLTHTAPQKTPFHDGLSPGLYFLSSRILPAQTPCSIMHNAKNDAPSWRGAKYSVAKTQYKQTISCSRPRHRQAIPRPRTDGLRRREVQRQRPEPPTRTPESGMSFSSCTQPASCPLRSDPAAHHPRLAILLDPLPGADE